MSNKCGFLIGLPIQEFPSVLSAIIGHWPVHGHNAPGGRNVLTADMRVNLGKSKLCSHCYLICKEKGVLTYETFYEPRMVFTRRGDAVQQKSVNND